MPGLLRTYLPFGSFRGPKQSSSLRLSLANTTLNNRPGSLSRPPLVGGVIATLSILRLDRVHSKVTGEADMFVGHAKGGFYSERIGKRSSRWKAVLNLLRIIGRVCYRKGKNCLGFAGYVGAVPAGSDSTYRNAMRGASFWRGAVPVGSGGGLSENTPAFEREAICS